MSLELVANDGSSRVLRLFESTNEIRVQTIKIMLGSTMVELSTTHQANSPTSLDVVLQQQQDPVAPLPSSRDATAATSLPQEIAPSRQPQATKASTEVASAEKQEKKNKRQREEMRGWLLMVATVFAAMTYQAGLSPPAVFEESLPSGNVTGIINMITPSFTNTTMVSNTSSNMATPSNESPDHAEGNGNLKKYYRSAFVTANTVAFVYSMSATVLLLSNTLCDMLDGRTDLKAVMVINAFIIALAYSVGCETNASISIGPLIAMCVIVSAYVGDYVYRKIFKKESIFGMLCREASWKSLLKDSKIGKKMRSRLLSGEQKNVEALAARP